MTVTSRLHRQKDKERQRKTEENVDRRPVVAPRYESGGEAQALERPARDRGLPLHEVYCGGGDHFVFFHATTFLTRGSPTEHRAGGEPSEGA